MSRKKVTDNQYFLSIGYRILQVRKSTKLSQPIFAEKIGESRGAPAISEWENNVYTPHVIVIRKICETFSINANWLLTGKGDMQTTNTPSEHHPDKHIDTLIQKTLDILTSDSVYSGALTSNIIAFHQSLEQGAIADKVRECEECLVSIEQQLKRKSKKAG